MLLLHGLVERCRAVSRLSVSIGPGRQQQVESLERIAAAGLAEDRRTNAGETGPPRDRCAYGHLL